MLASPQSIPGSQSSSLRTIPRPNDSRSRTLAFIGPPDASAGHAFSEYFRAPVELSTFRSEPNVNLLADRAGHTSVSDGAGYFRFGDAVCYGRPRGGQVALAATGVLPDATEDGRLEGVLPFDLSEVARNLRHERYRRRAGLGGLTSEKAARKIYYFLRPALSVTVQKQLQRISLRGWDRISFPHWPVDVSVDRLMRSTMGRLLESGGVDRIPFIWFWPDGAPSCLMLTHDVEGACGRAFCQELMDLDDGFGMKASFQVVPEEPGQSFNQTRALVDAVRSRGFEVNLHDLNHDGRLFEDRREFLERAARINRHAGDLECHGFRSGAMYREQEWFDAFGFSFDMSVPNVAHLEPQRGGCCTVMPLLRRGDPRAAVDDDSGLLALSHPRRLFHRSVEGADRPDSRGERAHQHDRASGLPPRAPRARGLHGVAELPFRTEGPPFRLDGAPDRHRRVVAEQAADVSRSGRYIVAGGGTW